VQAEIRRALGSCEDLVIWRQNVGLYERDGRAVRAGLCVGSSDLIGILHVEMVQPAHQDATWGRTVTIGRFIALEVKTRTGRVSPEQARFLELVRRMGGFGAVVRSPEEALDAVERARKGERE
jgi:hypothetical protein